MLSELAMFEPYSFMAVANYAKQFTSTLKPAAPQAKFGIPLELINF
jgi:hypothetical protein